MKLIDKSSVIGEIEKIMDKQQEICKNDVANGKEPNPKNVEVIYQFQQFIKVLNKLETTEVDLEKEIDEYMKSHHLHIKDGGRIAFENDDTPNFMFDFHDIAQYFYKLGLKAKGDIFVVTRCEGLSDYVEKAFTNEVDAENYCRPYNEDGISFIRDITKVKLE